MTDDMFILDGGAADDAVDIASRQATLTYWFYTPSRRAEALVDALTDRGFVLERCSPSLTDPGEHLVIVAGASGWLARRADLDELARTFGGEYDGWETGVLLPMTNRETNR